MKRECPFCGRIFYRNDMAYQSDKHCRRCIDARIICSGAKTYSANNSLKTDSKGYILVK